MLQRRQGRNYKCRRLCGVRNGIEQDARLASTGDRFDATPRTVDASIHAARGSMLVALRDKETMRTRALSSKEETCPFRLQ
jgi:hypothetical protein